MKINEIYEGWKNLLFPSEDLKEAIKAVSEKRMKMCEACPNISTKHKTIRKDVHCISCGCPLAAKTRALSSACPLGFWKEEVTLEQQLDIEQNVK